MGQIAMPISATMGAFGNKSGNADTQANTDVTPTAKTKFLQTIIGLAVGV